MKGRQKVRISSDRVRKDLAADPPPDPNGNREQRRAALKLRKLRK